MYAASGQRGSPPGYAPVSYHCEVYAVFDRLVTMWVTVWRVVTLFALLSATFLAVSLLRFLKHLTSNDLDFNLPPLTWRVLNVPSHLLAVLKALIVLWKYVPSHLTLSHKYFCPFQAHSNSIVYHFHLAFQSFIVVIAIISLQLVTYMLNDRWLCTALDGSHPTDSATNSDPSLLLGNNSSLPPFSSAKEELPLALNLNLIVRAAYYNPRPRNATSTLLCF